jgi:hypothetical protein
MLQPERCPRCDDTGLKDYAGFGMDLCECRLPAPALPAPIIIGPATLHLGDGPTPERARHSIEARP